MKYDKDRRINLFPYNLGEFHGFSILLQATNKYLFIIYNL